jgi:osmotically-inducible protein OsmY
MKSKRYPMSCWVGWGLVVGWSVTSLAAVSGQNNAPKKGTPYASASRPVAVQEAGAETTAVDPALLASLKIAWLGDPATFALNLGVKKTATGICITGFVPNDPVKQRVLQIASQSAKIVIEDQTKVYPGMSMRWVDGASKEALRRQVLELLEDAMPGCSQSIQVAVSTSGKVTLLGMVRSHDEELALCQSLRKASHCSCVLNRLEVTGSRSPLVKTTAPNVTVAAKTTQPYAVPSSWGNTNVAVHKWDTTQFKPVAMTPNTKTPNSPYGVGSHLEKPATKAPESIQIVSGKIPADKMAPPAVKSASAVTTWESRDLEKAAQETSPLPLPLVPPLPAKIETTQVAKSTSGSPPTEWEIKNPDQSASAIATTDDPVPALPAPMQPKKEENPKNTTWQSEPLAKAPGTLPRMVTAKATIPEVKIDTTWKAEQTTAAPKTGTTASDTQEPRKLGPPRTSVALVTWVSSSTTPAKDVTPHSSVQPAKEIQQAKAVELPKQAELPKALPLPQVAKQPAPISLPKVDNVPKVEQSPKVLPPLPTVPAADQSLEPIRKQILATCGGKIRDVQLRSLPNRLTEVTVYLRKGQAADGLVSPINTILYDHNLDPKMTFVQGSAN